MVQASRRGDASRGATTDDSVQQRNKHPAPGKVKIITIWCNNCTLGRNGRRGKGFEFHVTLIAKSTLFIMQVFCKISKNFLKKTNDT
jgi:hypothetical protein